MPALEPGAFHPLGATWDGRGVNFALFSEHATAVELCLFDEAGLETRLPVPWRSIHVWHAYVPGLGPGQRYGWRVHGPYAPAEGHRFNPAKLLVDPYTRALDGVFDPTGPVYGSRSGSEEADLHDDARSKPRSVVIDDAFDWRGDRPPRVPWRETVIYEIHVAGFTRRHPGVAERERGTFLGLGSDAAIAHLRSLGVTTVDLMPVHEHLDEPALVARGLKNYWGYSTLAYFAPDRRFATRGGDALREMKEMVRRLHAAGIEVILDVVYNHSCEGDALGPTVTFRGIDNSVYYHLKQDAPSVYVDYTGCGNTLDVSHPQVLKLVTDSLRYWVNEVHVDGFRFDLAPSLSRGREGPVDHISSFFAVVHQDPVLSHIKLIAEPWDVGSDGYQVGNFPILWSEWNGRFRDTVRSFWRGDRAAVADLGYRVTGSSDLYADDGRHPHASVNLVTAHDGFTLRDLVSYERKHNLDNGEDGRDGTNDNLSQNCGAEGDTDDPAILARRRALARSLMATLFVSQGVPMIEMGDEQWRTQAGNNNAYCQDSELTWVDWSDRPAAREMLEYVRRVVDLRRRHPALRQPSYLTASDITWLRPAGGVMTVADWKDPPAAALAFRLEPSPERVAVVVLMNAEAAPLVFRLPAGRWRADLDTATDAPAAEAVEGAFVAAASSVVVLVAEGSRTPA